MVCTAKDLLEWKDFPKGLRVLLLYKDVNYASEVRSKLEGMNYIVSLFCHEDEAISAALSSSDTFHVAIVEVSTIDCDGRLKYLHMTKGLPTIVIASIQCVTTSMKCIALGAVEVLNKPVSEDKLRNIWQHVVHKAYNPGENAQLPSSVKELVSPLVKGVEVRNEFLNDLELPCLSDSYCDDEQDRSSGYDNYPAPSTPQLKRVRSVDHTACQNQTNRSTGNDSAEHCEESKSVETTCFIKASDMPAETDQQIHDSAIKEENDSAYGCKSESDTSPQHKKQPEMETSSPGRGGTQIQNTLSDSGGTSTAKINRKKMKVDWTSDLHKKFVQAVEQLGVDQAIPSRILEIMKVEGLTRHNVASHLQKYRMHRRHALPKREERKLSLRPKDTMQSSYYYQHMPIMAYPQLQQPYNSNQTVVGNQAAYPMWLHTSSYTAALSAWGPPYQTWPWKSHTAMQAEAWGCPVMPPHGSYSYYPQIYDGVEGFARSMSWNFHKDHQLEEEVIDKTVKEAISKPWLPLPIGLKPPSTESVLSELSKQGILNIPPPSS